MKIKTLLTMAFATLAGLFGHLVAESALPPELIPIDGPPASRSRGGRAHRNWKRRRAAGITMRKRA